MRSLDIRSAARRLGRGLRREWCHQDFIHAVAVHIHDLESKPAPGKLIAGGRDAPELLHHQAAHRLIRTRLFTGQGYVRDTCKNRSQEHC